VKGTRSITTAQPLRLIAKRNAVTSLYLLSATVATLTFSTLVPPTNAQAKSNTETAGDIIQVLIPATAFGATLFQDDEEGRMQFYKSFFTNLGTTYALKYAINKPRPENHGDHSFPSGHTSAAFQGATFIHLRYGWEYSIPAYLGASFVGWSRVEGESDKHDATDVFAGAAVGILSSFFFTDRFEKLTVVPIVDNGVYGIGITGRW
jgi:membrane-associated phospholipid phosphatase